MATQLAEALEVSLDYLVGATDTLLEQVLLIGFLIFKN